MSGRAKTLTWFGTIGAVADAQCAAIYSGPFQFAVCPKGHWITFGSLCPYCPPDGMVACPADAPHGQCVLCRGKGWIEELVEP